MRMLGLGLVLALLAVGCNPARKAADVADGIVLKQVTPGLCFAVATYGEAKGGVAISQVDCCHLAGDCREELEK